ncbi:MAG: tetratricopeptide repeat protein [Candidatus Omnitrophica bacterium]|nr:tetratricopeptide repeat protein [Candidatus Omnitrophota bacterium]
MIFASGVQVLTAQTQFVGEKIKDIGKQNELAVQEAELFTKYYEQFEHSSQIQPNGIYVRLHGLVDIVTIGKLLRYMGIDYAILRDFSSLPYVHQEVPNYYQGLTVLASSEQVVGGVIEHSISGGVDIMPRAGDYSVQWCRDRAMAALEAAVDNFSREKGWSAVIKGKLRLPCRGSGSADDVESLMDAGRIAFALRLYETARDHFLKVTEKNPLHTEAFVQLGITYSLLGQFQEAKTAIARALAQEPADKQLEAIALDIELHSNPKFDLKGSDESVRRILSEAYARKAAADINQGRTSNAQKAADIALQLWDTNAGVYFDRALTHGQTFSPEGERDLLQAIRQYKKLLSEKDDPEVKVRLARTLAVHASCRITRIRKMIAGGTVETNSGWVLEELAEIADEAHDAQLIDDHEPGCLVTEALARATKVEVMQLVGQGGNLMHARELIDLAVKRFPDFSEAHSARAYVLIIAGEYTEALAELEKAIKMNPAQGSLFLLRADVYLRQQLYAQAKADLERAKQLGAEIDSGFEKKIYLHM